MDKAMIEIEKLKEEIKLLKEEKRENSEKQNELENDLSVYNRVTSGKKHFMKELKILKIKKAMLYSIYAILCSLMLLGGIVGSFLNPTIGGLLVFIGAVSLIVNEIPNIGTPTGDRIIDSAVGNVQSDINEIKEKFEKAKEVVKNRTKYENDLSELKVRDEEITDSINDKNNRITKLENLRKEVIEKFSPTLEQKISISYENFEEENTKAKMKIKS